MSEKNVVEEFGMRVAHVGLNAKNTEEAEAIAKQFQLLFGLPVSETPISYFNGGLVEIMKENGRGTNGHIGFAVNDCEAAMNYFLSRGLHVIEESKRFTEEGKCCFVYFEEEIAGFAIHLIYACNEPK